MSARSAQKHGRSYPSFDEQSLPQLIETATRLRSALDKERNDHRNTKKKLAKALDASARGWIPILQDRMKHIEVVAGLATAQDSKAMQHLLHEIANFISALSDLDGEESHCHHHN